MTRLALFAVLLAALAGSASSQKCGICVGPADPQTVAREHLAASVVAGAAAGKRANTTRAPWFPLLLGGELWSGWRGGEYWSSDGDTTGRLLNVVKAVRPAVMHGAILGPELLTGIHSAGKIYGFTPIQPLGLSTVGAYLAWWKAFIAEAHRAGTKVQATFDATMIWDDAARSRGFFRYYNELWEARALGARPAGDPAGMLQLGRDGSPLQTSDDRLVPGFYAYKGCLNNPRWRALLKQFVRAGVEAGFDGFMVIGLFRDDCLCRHCRKRFLAFLRRRHPDEELRDRFGIDPRNDQTIDSTHATQAGVLAVEARRFTDESVKDAFDDVFVRFGRSLKRDLMLSAWTHQRKFLGADTATGEFRDVVDERALLPFDRWASSEDYLWYCLGSTGSRLSHHDVGDASISAKFIYSMGSGRPFILQKYDYARPRLTLAEAWAHRGTGLALDVEGYRDVLQPYYDFIHRYKDLYYPSEPLAEVALLFPRRALPSADAFFLPAFNRAARELLDRHVLFDIVIDQRLAEGDLDAYRAVVAPDKRFLAVPEQRLLERYRQKGGTVLRSVSPELDRLALSACGARWTVQMTAWSQRSKRRIVMHFVNYDRDENAAGLENPRPSAPFRVDLNLPASASPVRVEFVTPEEPERHALNVHVAGGRAVFEVPGFSVYGVAVVSY